ncbi:MAG: hypothetical protein SFW67_09220 [Myxococcaceae bacterium]|nr:hypothetical protein [Myxococcaceae bacterium]
MRSLAPLVLLLACDAPPRPPPVAPKVAPVAEAAPPVDAGPPTVTVPVDELDGVPTTGLADDPRWSAEDVRDSALQRLLLRDPERLVRVFEQVNAPSAFHIGIVAAIARRRGLPGPAAAKPESELPELPASGEPIDGPGEAFVGVATADVRAPPKKRGAKPGAVLASLPAGTRVTVDALDGGTANVTVSLAARVDFGPTGTEPVSVTWKSVSGVVPAASLVRAPLEPVQLATEAMNEPETDEGFDRALVRWHRLFLLRPTEGVRAKLLEAAWRARRPSWVASAALERVWAVPRRARLAYGCRGPLERAVWTAPRPKLPEAVCVTDVDVRQPCTGAAPKSLEAKRALLQAAGFDDAQPVFEVVVDASRARRLYAVSMPIRLLHECEEGDDHRVDPQSAVVRRLPLPLGTSTTVVTLPVSGYHGVEHSVVGAQSEAKARDWLRSRTGAKWTYDARGEPAPSLGIEDIGFSLEGDVPAVSRGRLPQLDCALCGGQDFR